MKQLIFKEVFKVKFVNFWLLILVLSILIVPCQSYAQYSLATPKQNQLYLELGGNGLIYSINYERFLSENFTIRGGFGITPGFFFVEGTFIDIPVTASYLIGSERSKLEMGLGATFLASSNVEVFGLDSGDQSLIILTGIVGYRYTSPSGFVFRIFFTPLYSSEGDPPFVPYFGLSFGFML
jgi:hypothetical protein